VYPGVAVVHVDDTGNTVGALDFDGLTLFRRSIRLGHVLAGSQGKDAGEQQQTQVHVRLL
jgi:hypothetical protein